MIVAIPSTLHQDCPEHSHNLHELVICVDAGAQLHTPHQQHAFQAGGSFLIEANTPHAFTMTQPYPVCAHIFCFDDAELSNNQPKPVARLIAGLFNRPLQASAAQECVTSNNIDNAILLDKTMAEKAPLHEEVSSSLLSLLLLNHINDQQPAPQPTSPVRHRQIEHTIGWINEHLRSDICIADAARKASMSRSSFTKHFREYTGKSFTEYMAYVRIHRAADLLALHGTLTITDIAFDSGYKNLGHFFKQFQQHFDMTPNQYRSLMSTQHR